MRVGLDHAGRESVELVLEIVGRIDAPQLPLGEVVENVEASDESERGVRVDLVPVRQEAAEVLSRLLPPAVHHQALQEPQIEKDARLVLQPG